MSLDSQVEPGLRLPSNTLTGCPNEAAVLSVFLAVSADADERQPTRKGP